MCATPQAPQAVHVSLQHKEHSEAILFYKTKETKFRVMLVVIVFGPRRRWFRKGRDGATCAGGASK